MTEETPSAKVRPPSTETEKAVARIWEEIMGISGIMATDDFFELGGHSLLAVQVMSMISEETQSAELPVSLLLQSPTVAELALWVEQA
jgi:nocardicin nonribosomal peptide synthetase NocB